MQKNWYKKPLKYLKTCYLLGLFCLNLLASKLVYAEAATAETPCATTTTPENPADPCNLLPTTTTGTFLDRIPQGDIFSQTGKGIIKIILAVSGILLIAAVIVAAVMMITSRGKEDTLKKGKDILINAVIGLIVIGVANAVIYGLLSLEYFNP